MNLMISRYIGMAVVLLVLLLAGCASPSQPTRFYRLDSQLSGGGVAMPSPEGEARPLLGIGPVSLAGYLDRPQLIERDRGHRLILHEFDQWAGTLQENILAVLSREMQQALPRVQVISYPWNSGIHPGYELYLNVSRFDRQADKIGLEARWSLLALPDNKLVRLEQAAIDTPLAGRDMESVVAASSQAMRTLAREIAAQLPYLLRHTSAP